MKREAFVGTFTVEIEIIGPSGAGTEAVEALVDTGATYTMLPRPLLERLGIVPIEQRRFRLANEQVVVYPIGEARVRMNGREWTTVVVFGEPEASPVLGSMTLEGFGLAVDTVNQRLVEVEGLLKVLGLLGVPPSSSPSP